MLFRMKYEKLGGHVHVAVFAGKGTRTLGKCGDLVFREEEWEEFQKNLFQFLMPGSDIEVVPKEQTEEND